MSKGGIIAIVVVILVIIAGLAYVFWPKGGEKPSGGKVAIVFDVGGRGDLSFNDMAWLGAENAKKDFNLTVEYVTPQSEADFVPTLSNLAESGDYLIIVGIGFLIADAIDEVAQNYTNQKFAIIDAVVDRPNVASYVFREQECGALIGVLAAVIAHNTGNDKVAALMGMSIPPLWRFHIGYEYGVKWYDQQTGQNTTVLYVYTGTFGDPATGKDYTLQLLDQGANVVYGLAGATHIGAFDAVKEKAQETGQPYFAIGQDASQEWYDPDHIIVSGRKKVDVAVYDAIESAYKGTFQGGVHSLGLAEGGVGVSTLDEVEWFAQLAADTGHLKDMTPQEVRQKVAQLRDQYIGEEGWNLVDQLKQQILGGLKFVNPPSQEEYETVIQQLEAGNLNAAIEQS